MKNDLIDDLDIAILHDRFPQIGGGELVALESARVLDAPIYTMYVASGVSIPTDVKVISLQQKKYTGRVSKRVLGWKSGGMNPLEPVSVMFDMAGAESLHDYDVIFGSGPLAKSYVPKPHQTVINYPHSPPRWLYDQYTERLKSFNIPGVAFGIKCFANIMRALDKQSNDYVDCFVANSEVVQNRIKRYYSRGSEVIYPPIETEKWYNERDSGYFVTWSRLVPNKRVSLIVEAFKNLDERLVVAGEGDESDYIKSIAESQENIDFRGYVDDIHSLVSEATAVVYAPRDEDFGMVGAEALAAGKPLLGVDSGFTRHQVVEGVTGLRFQPTIESIQKTITQFDPNDFDTQKIQCHGDKYSDTEFDSNLKEVVIDAYESKNN